MRGFCEPMKVAVVSHFDRHDLADDYFVYSLRCYRRYFDYIVVVSTSMLDTVQRSRILIYADKLVVKENRGYDFVSWRTGFEELNVERCKEISFVNDSFYGPVNDIEVFMGRGRSIPVDVWGATLSMQFAPHIQSFFMTFNENIIRSQFLETFWSRIEVLHDKNEIIQRYEIGLSQELCAEGFSIGAVVDMRNLTIQDRHAALQDNLFSGETANLNQERYYLEEDGPNPMQLFWGHALRAGVPFVKIELLRDNPLDANLSAVFKYLERHRWYELGLIIRHLERIIPSEPFLELRRKYLRGGDK
ncbi:putative glycosyltransferase, fusion protein [Methylobacterium sp. GXF4]|nr:putative glycosyltransferase, fusion protein [Methylobacterium sp. GXF4]